MIKYKIQLLNNKNNLKYILNMTSKKFILDTAEMNNIQLPYSCRIGSCSTCLARSISGTIKHVNQTFLTRNQIKNNFILTCVATVCSNAIILTHEEENFYI